MRSFLISKIIEFNVACQLMLTWSLSNVLYSIVILPQVFIRIGHILERWNELFGIVQQTLPSIND